MRYLKILLIFIVLPLYSYTAMHKFYVSVTQIDYVKEKESVQVTMRIFVDDFENILRKRYDQNITLQLSEDEPYIDKYIGKYLDDKIDIKINKQSVSFDFLGKEYDHDIMYCYLEINNIKAINHFEITNNLFFEMFEEQQNIVKTQINSKNKSFLLTSQNNKSEIFY
ncbi:MAG: DUF6702 family protein [Flavobacteriaceae bacterium]